MPLPSNEKQRTRKGSLNALRTSRQSRQVLPMDMKVPVERSLARLRRVRSEVRVHLPPILKMGSTARSTSAQIEGLSPEAALNARRNFRFGVANGIMFTLVDALVAPTLVMAWFISRLGAPNVLVGLLPAILTGGWFLPQLLVATRVQGLVRVIHWYRRVGVFRTLCMGLLALTTFLLAATPNLLLVAFFFLYVLYAVSAGMSGIPWLEMVGKVVAPRRRGSFFGLRNFWGGVLALLAAAPIGAILSEQLWGLTFPYNFAFLFAVTAVVVGLGIGSWASIREPAAVIIAPQVTVRSILRRGMEVVRQDPDYRSFMLARILISLASIADPFYVVYAKTDLGAPAATVGLYIGAISIASLLSNFLWSPLSDRAGNRTLMVLTVVSVSMVPLLALLLSMLVGVVPSEVLFASFALVFVLSGLALGAARIINNNMLLSIAPPAERATYIGFLNTVLGIVILVPVLGGVLVDIVGFQPLFVLSLLFSSSALLVVRKMSTKHAV